MGERSNANNVTITIVSFFSLRGIGAVVVVAAVDNADTFNYRALVYTSSTCTPLTTTPHEYNNYCSGITKNPRQLEHLSILHAHTIKKITCTKKRNIGLLCRIHQHSNRLNSQYLKIVECTELFRLFSSLLVFVVVYLLSVARRARVREICARRWLTSMQQKRKKLSASSALRRRSV